MPATRPIVRLASLAAVLALSFGLLLVCDPRQWLLLRNTLLLSSGACVIALPVGTALAFLLVRTDLPGRSAASLVLGVMLLVPLYLQATAWDAGFGQLGWYSVTSDAVSSPLLRGWQAAIWIHGLASIPWVALLVGAGLRLVESELEEQALLDGSALRVCLYVTLPRVTAAIGVAALWVLLSTAAEMTVTDLYRIRTYAEELYTGFALGDDWGAAGLTVLPGMLAQGALVLLAGLVISSVARPLQSAERPASTFPLRFYRGPALGLVLVLLALTVGVPLGNLLVKAGTVVEQVGALRWRHWSVVRLTEVLGRGITDYGQEFRWTLVISGQAATIAVAAGAGLAWLARRGGTRAWPAMLTAACGLAVPGPLVGLGVIWLLDREQPVAFAWLYDRTVAAPVLAIMVRVLPLAILICGFAWRTIADDVLDAATCDGAGAWTRFWRIAVPQRLPALGAAWLAAFAWAAGDLACSILVVPPGVTTVPIRVFGLIHSGVDQQVAGICLIAAAGYAVLAGGVLALLGRKKMR